MCYKSSVDAWIWDLFFAILPHMHHNLLNIKGLFIINEVISNNLENRHKNK